MYKLRPLGAVCFCALLAACASSSVVPLHDRSYGSDASRRTPLPASGEIVVQRGDTLYGLSFRHGQDFRQVAVWNGVAAPYTIYPGQRLLMAPPANAAVASTRPAAASTASPQAQPGEPVTIPIPSATTRQPQPETLPEQSSRPDPPVQAPPPAVVEPRATPSAGTVTSVPSGALVWQWPTEGRLLRTFSASDAGRKGIDIVGEAGQPVRAAAAGEVVYSGDGLIGYGELIIIKHSPSLLSAYGHNRRRMVDPGDIVDAGQQIAEMGRSGTDRERLHFEIRQNGQPVDPLRFLPTR